MAMFMSVHMFRGDDLLSAESLTKNLNGLSAVGRGEHEPSNSTKGCMIK